MALAKQEESGSVLGKLITFKETEIIKKLPSKFTFSGLFS